VLLLAALMRFWGVADTPFWSDEAWNLWVVQSDFSTDVARLAANHHPPAYFWALDGWRRIAGESKLALSFVAIAAGMLTAAIVYRTGRDMGGLSAAIAAGLVFASFEQAVYYGQSIRHYSFLLLGAALTLWLLMRALRRPTWPRFLAYGAAVAFTAYSLYIGALVIALQALFGLLVWRGAWRDKLKLVGAYGFALVLFTPWLPVGLGGALSKIERGAITNYLNSLATTPQGVQTMLDIVWGGQAALGLALTGLALWRWGWRGVRALPVWCGMGVLVVMCLINLRLGIVSERTLAMLAPAAALTVGLGVLAVPSVPRRWLVGALVVWSVVTVQGVLPRLNSDTIAQAVAAGYTPTDLVILETGFDDAAFGYQLERTLPPEGLRVFRSYYEYDFPDDPSMMAALDAQLAQSQRVWLVYWNVPPRMADKLRGLGFGRIERQRLPVGSGDPLYVRDPIAEVSLWVRPPDVPQFTGNYDNGLMLHGAIVPRHLPAGLTSLHIDSWWQASQPIDRDYTVGAFLIDASTGQTLAESFAPPPDQPMTTWPTDRLIPVRHRFSLPQGLAVGEVVVRVVVYWYQTPDAPVLYDGQPTVTLGQVSVFPSAPDGAPR
jgi:hypothetical protein